MRKFCTGYSGIKGDQGLPGIPGGDGRPGLPGRDGIPGEKGTSVRGNLRKKKKIHFLKAKKTFFAQSLWFESECILMNSRWKEQSM